MPLKLDQEADALTASAPITAGGAILARLKSAKVDYIFANSGTDFPPIIEGAGRVSRGRLRGRPMLPLIPQAEASPLGADIEFLTDLRLIMVVRKPQHHSI